MSHFKTLVIVPEDTGNIEEGVCRLLAPYDEEISVAPTIDEKEYVVRKEMEIVKLRCKNKDEEDYIKEYADKIDTMSVIEFAKSWYGRPVDVFGNVYSRYNKDSKWDWWSIGGRWSEKDNQIKCKDIKEEDYPFAVVDPEGIWYESGKMLYWAISVDNKSDDDWKFIVKKILETYPDHIAAICDLHI